MDSERRRVNPCGFAYHQMALMTPREFDANGHRRWETKVAVLVTCHMSHRQLKPQLVNVAFFTTVGQPPRRGFRGPKKLWVVSAVYENFLLQFAS